jgi:hypothetical protein
MDTTHNNNNNNNNNNSSTGYDPYTHNSNNVHSTRDTYTVCGDTTNRSDASSTLNEGGKTRPGMGAGVGGLDGENNGNRCDNSNKANGKYGHKKQVFHTNSDANVIQVRNVIYSLTVVLFVYSLSVTSFTSRPPNSLSLPPLSSSLHPIPP